MEDYGFDFARADLLEKAGKLVDAAELHLAEGRTLVAINLLLQDRDDERALPRAVDALLDGLWKCLSFGIKPNVPRSMPDSMLDSLLHLAEDIVKSTNLSEHKQTQVWFNFSNPHYSHYINATLSLKCSKQSHRQMSLPCCNSEKSFMLTTMTFRHHYYALTTFSVALPSFKI